MNPSKILFPLMFVLISGCASKPLQPIVMKSPLKSDPHAILTLKRAFESFRFGEGIITTFSAFDDINCTKRIDLAAMLSPFSSPKEFRVAPKDRIFLRMHTKIETFSNRITCTNLISFIPETGKAYEGSHKFIDHKNCSGDLVEVGTSNTLRSYESYALPASCKF